jgi:hypothetical protein
MSKAAQAEPRLRRLSREGSLPASLCGSAFLDFVNPLIESGVLVWKRTGAGQRLEARSFDILSEFIANTYPRDKAETGAEWNRIHGVARFRDSKALANDAPEIILLRAWSEDALLIDAAQAGAAHLSREHGAFAFILNDRYSIQGRFAIVENPVLFHSMERLNLDLSGAVLSRGCMSQRFLQWLGSQKLTSGSVLHLPDYDPIGLSEFLRLRDRLGDVATLHLPADLEERFRIYSNPLLLEPARSGAILSRLRASPAPQVQEVLQLIDRFGGGLEQEALLI